MRVFFNINVHQSSPRGKTWPLRQPLTVGHLVEQVLVFEKDSILNNDTVPMTKITRFQCQW